MTDESLPDHVSSPVPNRPPKPSGKRGRLKIFLGIGPGAGKTAAMLDAGLSEKLSGRQVVIGVVHAHGVRAIEGLSRKLPWARVRHHAKAASADDEMDIDAVFARQPDIVIIDELAHANPPGARHPQRFQDALELVEAGIDVYTTLNIYEIDSRANLVWEGPAAGRQSVPDTLIEEASLELVDIPASELIQRWKQGNIHLPESFDAKPRFFEEGNLMGLREMAARLFTERVAKEAQDIRQTRQVDGPALTGHRVLVALDSASDSEHLILWTRRLAANLGAPWIVLYVETPSEARFEEDSRLTPILDLARELGGDVVTAVDENFADAALRVALSHNTTQIVAGKEASGPWWRVFSRSRMVSRLIRKSGTLGVHLAPTRGEKFVKLPRRRLTETGWIQYMVTAGTIGVVTLLGFMFTPLVGAHATALLFLLATVMLALFIDRGPTLLAAALSALSWDYFFLPPVFAFQISHFEDAFLLMMFFVGALVMGQVTVRIRAQEARERQREGRATTLYLLTRGLAEATTVDQIVRKVVEEMGRSFHALVAVLLPDATGHLCSQPANSLEMDEKDQEAADWAFERRQAAGKFTGNLPMAGAIFIPLDSGDGVLGVIGLRLNQPVPPSIHQKNILDAISRQIALALDRQRLSALSEKAKVLAESERLGKTLLDSMSHEIRTPLAAIKTALTSLIDLKSVGPPIPELIAEVQEASERLNRLVGKALDITRLDSGYIKPLFNECEVNDIVNVAVAETEKELARHQLAVEIEPKLPIIRADFVFLQQALMNLLSNAAFHTPAGTHVSLRVWRKDDSLFLSVADRGPGLDPQSLARVFDKFYRGPDAPTGGTGLGLSLVKGFVEALGGKVTAANRPGGGAEFTIALSVPVLQPPTLSQFNQPDQ